MFGLFEKEPAKPKPEREFFRACNVYCQPDTDQVLVAAVYNHGGLMAEMPGGATILKFSARRSSEPADEADRGRHPGFARH